MHSSSRRLIVTLAAALAILGIGVVVAGIILSATQTQFGRDRIRQFINVEVGGKLKGKGTMFVGRIRGGLLTGVTIDSIEIRDDEDSLFVRTGPIELVYDPRDIFDKRLLFSRVIIHRPVINVRRHADGVWNYRRIFPSNPNPRPRMGRGIGDFIVLDSAEVRDGTVIVTQPWDVPDSLKSDPRRYRRALDSAVADAHKEIRHTSEGVKRTYRWRNLQAVLPYARIANPDSSGRWFDIARLDVDEFDPPFAFRNVAGHVQMNGDTAWLALPHFDLPRSTGSASGQVTWQGKQPVRYNLAVVGDSVSLSDINWVYPTLPKTGGGRMHLRIRNDPTNLRVLDYAITQMDVRSTGSHLTGDMTFGVGWPVLVVKDLNLRADPVDFRLIQTLNGKPFPVPWAGTISGTAKGKGGPLNRFLIDDARLVFRDANVPGAEARLVGRGGLDILFPAYTKFRGFDVSLETLDLRTIRFLYPGFPPLGGTIAGRATLDSSWLDVRFRNADVTHTDGPDVPSRFTGAGRVTYGTKFLTWDLDVQAMPVSFTTLALSYPTLKLRGPYTGPMRVLGTMENLDFATTLTGPAGSVAVDGHFDFYAPTFAARASGSVQNLDVASLFERSTLPPTRLTASFDADLSGDSLANLDGRLAVDLARSRFDTVRVFPSTVRLSFGGGHARVDTLRIESTAAQVIASGAIGLVPAARDTLHYSVIVDSLGGLRPYLRGRPPRRGTTLAVREDSLAPRDAAGVDSAVVAMRDSLLGIVTLAGDLIGSVDSLSTQGTLAGQELFVAGDAAKWMSGTYRFDDITAKGLNGAATLAFKSLSLAGVRLDSATAGGELADLSHGRLSARLWSATKAELGGAIHVARAADTTSVTVDSLDATVKDHRYALVAPAFIRADSTGVALDSLVLRSNAGGSLSFRGDFPAQGSVDMAMSIDSLSLGDVAELIQSRVSFDGALTLGLRATGPRASPTMTLAGRLSALQVGKVHIPFISTTGSYAERSLRAQLQLFRNGQPVLSANGVVPVDLAFTPVADRFPADSLKGRIFAERVDLAILEAATDQVEQVKGTMSTDIDISGTTKNPRLAGRFQIEGGELGLPASGTRLRALEADIRLLADSIYVRRLRAASGEQLDSRVALDGSWVSLRDMDNARFDIRAAFRDFQVVKKRRVADLQLTGDARLFGTRLTPVVTGELEIGCCSLYIQDRPSKQLANPDSMFWERYVRAGDGAGRLIIPRRSDLLDSLDVRNVQIRIGDNVWLRSAEAAIKLGGSLQAQKSHLKVALSGDLSADRGTYTVDMGVAARSFTVQSGLIRFFGDTLLDPALNIEAVHTVRVPNREDVRIRALIGGTLLRPRLTLTSDERIPISETEIVSYLVFGAPSFALGANQQSALRTALSLMLPTLSGRVERLVPWFDVVQIQAGALNNQQDGASVGVEGFRDIFNGTRLGVGKQLGERTFLSGNIGLCGVLGGGSSASDNRQSIAETVSVTLEHRFNSNLSLRAGVEPASSALLCGRTGGELNTPKQFGIDFFKQWKF